MLAIKYEFNKWNYTLLFVRFLIMCDFCLYTILGSHFVIERFFKLHYVNTCDCHS